MSEEFKLQKDSKKTIEITTDDLSDINLDELDNESSVSSGSIMFTKEKMNDLNGLFNSNRQKPSEVKLEDIFGGNKKKSVSPKKTSVNIKKDHKTSIPFSKQQIHSKPIVEPNSVDLGLNNLVNQSKKTVKDDEPSEVSYHSASSRHSAVDQDMDLDIDERVKHIMDEKSESSRSSSQRTRSVSGSDLSSLVKEKIKKKSDLTENQRKEELLFLFNKLEKKGFKLNQKFTMKSSLEDMERVYERLEHERNVKNSIRFQRRVLMGIVSTLEFLNTSINPFDIDLEGWSESIMENQTEYDDIFEELYEKYKNKGKVSPEVKLLMTLAGSAFYFHLSKTIVKSGQQKMNEMFGGDAPNLSSGGKGGGGGGGLGGLMSGLMNSFMNGGGGDHDEPITTKNSGMKGPQGFDDVLSGKSSDIPSIHSSIVSNSKKKRTLNF